VERSAATRPTTAESRFTAAIAVPASSATAGRASLPTEPGISSAQIWNFHRPRPGRARISRHFCLGPALAQTHSQCARLALQWCAGSPSWAARRTATVLPKLGRPVRAAAVVVGRPWLTPASRRPATRGQATRATATTTTATAAWTRGVSALRVRSRLASRGSQARTRYARQRASSSARTAERSRPGALASWKRALCPTRSAHGGSWARRPTTSSTSVTAWAGVTPMATVTPTSSPPASTERSAEPPWVPATSSSAVPACTAKCSISQRTRSRARTASPSTTSWPKRLTVTVPPARASATSTVTASRTSSVRTAPAPFA
jgi:hypothetical protein